MLALTYTGSLLFALSATAVWAKNQVCSVSECIEGYSTSPLLALDSSSLTYLLPGTYSSTSYSPTSPLNASIFTTSSSLIISTPDTPVGFTSLSYSGSGNIWTGNDWSMGSWKSIYLPNGWYAVLGQGKVLWGAIPEKNLLPMSVSWMGISYAGISACSPACSSHGTCIATNTSATCKCDEGWAGSICDSCATGYYGTSCTVGPSNCTIWDDGYIGTGKCLGTATSASGGMPLSVDVIMEHVPPPQSVLVPLDGRPTLSYPRPCATLVPKGSFKMSTIIVSVGITQPDLHIVPPNTFTACPLGCEKCELQANTNSTAACTSCSSTLSLSTTNPTICVSSNGTCFSGSYYDSSTSSCESCSPACSTCTGPGTSECLSCASPRVNLQGSCVGYDSTTGNCDSSLSGLEGLFVVNNQKSECDSCPAGCLSCYIPSFSNVASYESLICQACQEGYLLEDGQCVKRCSDGWFLPEGSATTNGTCQREGSAMCSSCSDGYMLKNGVCVDALCGDGGFANGFGMCLSSFVHKSQKRYLGFLALIGVAMIVGIVFWLHVRRERRKTRQATKEFGERLDKRNVNDRLAALRLEKVFGFNRVTFGRGGDRSTQTTREDGDKKNKLRKFLFPSKRRSGDEEMEMKKSNFAPDKERHLYDGWRTSDLGRDSWIAPPPYIASQGIPTPIDVKHSFNRRDSLDSIPTPCRQTFALPSSTYSLTTAGPATPSCKQQNSYLGSTIIHSMSTTSPLPHSCSLMPPPRRGTGRRESGNSFSGGSLPITGLTHTTNVMAEKERDVRRYSGEHDGQMDVERRLIDLWPGLKGRDREREGFI
ncbi:hypothetical protein D1P53_004330 [Cryptococcus gattii VGV]|nr:hypothetical protein D1P53_004330 [Cryptococcus gattii VGV]